MAEKSKYDRWFGNLAQRMQRCPTITAADEELRRELLPLLEAADGLYIIKSVSDGDGEWEAIRTQTLKRLRAELGKIAAPRRCS